MGIGALLSMLGDLPRPSPHPGNGATCDWPLSAAGCPQAEGVFREVRVEAGPSFGDADIDVTVPRVGA